MPVATKVMEVRAGAVRWHVELTGTGPDLLLVHGTAASSHSWAKLVPELAQRFRVLNLDLPGHGQSKVHGAGVMSLEGMAKALHALLQKLDFHPAVVAGHSAGAVILTRLCAQHGCAATRLVSFNGAFFPFEGAAASLFTPFAKLLALMPFLPNLLSALATRHTVEKLMRDTGSALSATDIDSYFALFKQPAHVAAALDMMANWDLSHVESDLAAVKATCTLVAGARDGSVPPASAHRAAKLCTNSSVHILSGLGHLLHEERPDIAAAIIRGDSTWPT